MEESMVTMERTNQRGDRGRRNDRIYSWEPMEDPLAFSIFAAALKEGLPDHLSICLYDGGFFLPANRPID